MHAHSYLRQAASIALAIDHFQVEEMATELHKVRERKARVYVIGLGGSLANAMHFAADLRKLCHIDATAPTNLSELTARANDEGMETIFTGWMRWLNEGDCLFILSVGGGTENVSQAITHAIAKAKAKGAKILGIVGPVGGITAQFADIAIRVPTDILVTPHTEAFQAVIWHCLVSHPLLQKDATKW